MNINSLLNRFGNQLIDQLISSGYHIIIRPHPQSFTSEKELIDRLMRDYPSLEWNQDIDNFDVLNRSDILISDFSGVIFDFALSSISRLSVATRILTKHPMTHGGWRRQSGQRHLFPGLS